LLAARPETVFVTLTLHGLVIPIHELRALFWDTLGVATRPLLLVAAVDLHAPIFAHSEEIPGKAVALACQLVPLGISAASADIVGILHARLSSKIPHVTSFALGDRRAPVL